MSSLYGLGQTMQAYGPSWRDKLAAFMMGDGRASPERRRFVEGLTGSTGLGTTAASVADVTPAGSLFALQEAAKKGDTHEMSLAALGMLPGVGAAERGAKGIIAYHGSPHSFDRFSLSKIGTGEGAQAYGHGLYFADREGVARAYRDALSGEQLWIDGNHIQPDADEMAYRVANHMNQMGWTVDQVVENSRKRIEKLSGDFASGPMAGNHYTKQSLDYEKDFLPHAERLLGKNIEWRPGGHMYQVRINADPAQFLDWDKPLSEQSDAVRSALSNSRSAKALGDPTGDRLHFSLTEKYGLDGATGQLVGQGIPGIKYLDQGSRGAGDGSRNYVVFNDQLIDILKKYGIAAGLAPLGAGAFMNQDAQPAL